VEQTKMVRYFGILVAAIMAFSMIAGIGYMVLNDPIIQNNNNDNPLEPTVSSFNYSLSFDANAIRDLSSFRVGLLTSLEDKAILDAEVKKVEGVSTVASQFRKDSTDSNEWIYLAEISVKKNAKLETVLEGIYAITYFKESSDKMAMKHMTISVPKSVMLHNADLNIDRNYSFASTTLSALTNISTVAKDELVVTGSITLQGSVITAIELIESQNKTEENRLISQIQTQEVDKNIFVDLNQ
jgi:hypothetical protein